MPILTQETVSLPRLGTLSTFFFFFFLSRARDCMKITLHVFTDFNAERVTAHRIIINDHSRFFDRWPNSKTKLKLKHLWEQGSPCCFRGPTQLAFSVYREDRWIILSENKHVLLYLLQYHSPWQREQRFAPVLPQAAHLGLSGIKFSITSRLYVWANLIRKVQINSYTVNMQTVRLTVYNCIPHPSQRTYRHQTSPASLFS